MSWLATLAEAALVHLEWLVLAYFALVNGWYLLLLASATLEMRRHASIARGQSRWKVLGSPLAPSISVLAPAYNEESTIVESLASLLTLQYPNLEVVVINDGSKDATLEILREHFQLVPVHPIYRRRVVTRPVRGLYRSPLYPNLVVVDKENGGGKADALNAGLNVASGSLVCAIDADTLIEGDALQRLVRPFLEDDDVMAAGGTVRIANDCIVRSGRVVAARVPRKPLPGLQVVEYLRAFLFGRLGWNRLGGNLIISGAFGLFRRDALLAARGWAHDAVGEDIELVLRLRRLGYERGASQRIAFLPDPIAWTEAPESLRVLGRQRERWHRGLADALWRHRNVFMNPRYGAMGLVVYPYYLIAELLAPLVELIGILGLAAGLALNVLNAEFALLFFLFAYGFGALLTVITLVMDELLFQRYTRTRDRVLLVFWALVENLGYRQLTVLWRLQGFEKYLRGTGEWGTMERRGFRTAPKPATPGRIASIALLLVLLGGSASAQSADSAWAAGDHVQAERLYTAWLETHPQDATALHRLALLHAWAGRWAESLTLFERLPAEDPAARTDRARVLAWSGDLDAAGRAADAVLDRWPDYAPALHARARFAAWDGDLIGAEVRWRRALARDPGDAAALGGLAEVLHWQGRFEAARAAADAALRIDASEETALATVRRLDDARSPRFDPRIIHERDSDGNRLTTWVMTGGWRLVDRASLSANVYMRSAAFHGSFDRDARPRGASITARTWFEPGWMLEAEAGASRFGTPDGNTVVTLGAAIATPARERMQLGIALHHRALDATSLTAISRVTVSSAALTGNARIDARTRFTAETGLARYRSDASGRTNRRIGASMQATRTVATTIDAGAQLTAFGFSHDRTDGYFDPETYVLAQATGAWTATRADWTFRLDAAAGAQKVDGGAVAGAYRAGARLSWAFPPDRILSLAVLHANARTGALSADAPSTYRYTSIALALGWTS